MKFKSIFFLLFISVGSCSKNNVMIIPTPPTPPVIIVDTSLYKMMPFPMGASVSISLMKNNISYNGIVTKEFGSITAENAMKFAALHPSENTYNWVDADYLVSYAVANNKRIHGHNLNWHQSLPTWVTNFSGDSLQWENLLKSHIQNVVTHFKGKVTSWDVVNEYFNSDGTVRNSIWVTKLGPDYIARCFQYANQADPAALLFYNDFGQEDYVAKRNAIAKLISSFQARGIPIHGIGLQFHIKYNESDANIAATIDFAKATGLKVHVSELDVAVNVNKTPGFVLTSAMATLQAEKYKYVVMAYNTLPKAQQYGITTWNVGDADSWIPAFQGAPDFPLPFDENYKRKPAYKSIIEGAK